MERLIEIAMDDPKRYFKNFLKDREKYNPTKVPILDKFIYCCIWAFIFTTLDKQKELYKNYYNLHNEYIDEEIERLKKSSDAEAKHSLERYPMIRSLLYRDEELFLMTKCQTINDYIKYIQKYGDSCRELYLYAKYRISIIDESSEYRFDELLEVINSYSYSDLFNLDSLKSRCVLINGLMTCFTKSVSSIKRDLITHLIENSTQVYIDDEEYEYYVCKPLTKRERMVLQDYDCKFLENIIFNFDEPVLLRRIEVTDLMMILKKETGLNWIMLDKKIINEYNLTYLTHDIWYKERTISLNIEEYHSFLPTIKISKNG